MEKLRIFFMEFEIRNHPKVKVPRFRTKGLVCDKNAAPIVMKNHRTRTGFLETARIGRTGLDGLTRLALLTANLVDFRLRHFQR